jgi:hypothetical protein
MFFTLAKQFEANKYFKSKKSKNFFSISLVSFRKPFFNQDVVKFFSHQEKKYWKSDFKISKEEFAS